MAESAELTDDIYEGERRQAEQAFLRGYKEWHQKLIAQARVHSRNRMKDGPDALRAQKRTAARVRGEELLQVLGRLCSAYGCTELAAYTALIERLAIPPSHALKRVRDHADTTVDESQRKWDAGMEELSRGFSFGNLPEIAWDHIQESLREFSKKTIERQLWTGPQSSLPGKSATQPSGSTAVVPETDATEADGVSTRTDPPAKDRKTLYFEFKARALSQGIKLTEKIFAQAANPGKWNDRTVVVWWKRHDPKSTHTDDLLIRRLLAKNPSVIWPDK